MKPKTSSPPRAPVESLPYPNPGEEGTVSLNLLLQFLSYHNLDLITVCPDLMLIVRPKLNTSKDPTC